MLLACLILINEILWTLIVFISMYSYNVLGDMFSRTKSVKRITDGPKGFVYSAAPESITIIRKINQQNSI